MAPFAFVRAEKVRDLPELSRLASHGRRLDPTGRRRACKDLTPFNLAGSRYSPDNPLDIVGAFRAAVAKTGAVTYGKAAIALHALVGISPQVICEAGGLHDPRNPLNKKLVEQAVAWAEGIFGLGATIAWRMDLDEEGGGVVDIFLVPTRIAAMNKSSKKRIVSVHGALDAVRIEHNEKFSYAALQSSWAAHARANIDVRLQRGIPETSTARTHLPPDVYRKVCEQALAVGQGHIEAREADLGELEALAQDAIIAADRARGAAEQQAAALKRARMRLHAHAQEELDATMRALTLGIQAVSDGRITGLEYDQHDGLARVVGHPELDDETWASLLDALAPAWDRGLPQVLENLLGARELAEGWRSEHQSSAMLGHQRMPGI
ncbi:hypothetical protein [Methylobacterium sp. WL8]|uniref:hypothetical protein n=1 Tax=Methylobacterium sp. WL8 TaxID=2603899 RepID=UPI0011CA3967|nr:hypothetical protein [Methylobacterium sp. WL8]TXN78599.1 hypothetical protein FV234_22465 [Methylobacterium sp. WL8]